MPRWTQEQHQAIYDRNQSLLISAAAGSGKTAVLIERIYSLIAQDEMDVERMLVVTFTRAAAAEMRERLHRRLQEDAQNNLHVRKQLDKLDRASISTLHVFCGRVIKEFFSTIYMDPTARLFEGGERSALFDQALAAAMEQAYETASKPFMDLAHRYNDEQIAQMVQTLYSFLMAQSQPWAWLSRHCHQLPNQNSLSSHPWFLSTCKDLSVQAQGLIALAEDMALWCQEKNAIPYCAQINQEDMALSIRLYEGLAHPGPLVWDLASSITLLSLGKVPRKKTDEEAAWYAIYQNKRQKWKDLLQKKILPQVPARLEKTLADIQNTAQALQGLEEVTLLFHEKFSTYKKERNVYDFNDLEHKTLEILQNPYPRQVLKERFDALFVDEYQDTSDIQEAILQALHENNQLFMVGDVKQSIYRFRLADPSLFLKKHQHFSSDPTAEKRKIDLQQNFRSHPHILLGINQVFNRIMDDRITEIRYDDKAQLIPALAFEEPAPIHLAVNLASFTAPAADKQEAPTKVQQEALFIADYLLNRHGSLIEEKGKKRHLTWKDMVVLMPKAKGVAKILADVLQEKGIPVYSDADEEYFSLPEVDTVMAFLQLIDNPLQDLPLLRVLKASPFLFSEEELAQIRLSLPEKKNPFHQCFFTLAQEGEESDLQKRCRNVSEQLDLWRKEALLLPLDQFIWRLLWDTRIYSLSGAMAAGEIRQGNLRLLCQKAYDFAQTQRGGLHEFILLTTSLSSTGDSQTAKILGEGEDVVRLMTIHKSKGLEFPLVVVMGLGSNMHLGGGKGELLLHKELGLALNYMNVPARITRKTFGQKAISLRKKIEEKAERARLLYVAMTRAKNHLLLIGTPSRESDLAAWALPPGPYSIGEANSMLDWVCQSVLPMEEGAPLREAAAKSNTFSPGYQQGANPWKIKVLKNFPTSPVEKEQSIHRSVETLLARAVAAPSLYPFYDPLPPTALPIKTSVSSLNNQNLFQKHFVENQEETPATKGAGEILVSPLALSPLPALPDFMGQDKQADLTPAQRGTVTHRLLGLIDLGPLQGLRGEPLHNHITDQANRLYQRGLFTQQEREALFISWLVTFFESSLGQRLLNSSLYYREWPFIYRLPQNNTLVQGVIDCCFMEEGAFVLLDYKTDQVSSLPLLKQRYQGQMDLYKQALMAITGVPVAQSYLYLLRRGESLLL